MRKTPEEQREAWATYVTALRTATGLSRADLAQRLRIDPSTVWRWETRRQKPESPDVAQQLATMFKLDLDEVLAAAGLKPTDEVPTEPTREVDEELELILTAKIPERYKRELLDQLEADRAADRQRRLDHYQRLVKLYGRGA